MLTLVDSRNHEVTKSEEHTLLASLGLVDARPEIAFDDLAGFARDAFAAPTAAITIVQPELDRQYFKSGIGLPVEVSAAGETPLSHSFCQFVRATDAPFVVADAEFDPRLSGNLAVTAYGVRSYLGCPIHLPDGKAIGAICVIDYAPRAWTSADVAKMNRICAYVDDAIAAAAARNALVSDPEMIEEERSDVEWDAALAGDIWRGLENDEFIPFYQPQFDAKTLRIVGVEVLMRWRHPERGLLSPFDFMDAAEALSLLPNIDAAVARRALADMEMLAAAGIPMSKVSFNVTSAALHDFGVVSSFKDARLPDTQIALEILESVLIEENVSDVDFNLDLLRDQGFSIEIDDFGSGHASIVGLLRVQPDVLKIDRRLVIPSTRSEKYRRILRSVIEIARSLGVSVTAEGVETAAHVDLLRELGCDVLQGFHFAKPMNFEDLRARVSTH